MSISVSICARLHPILYQKKHTAILPYIKGQGRMSIASRLSSLYRTMLSFYVIIVKAIVDMV